MTGKQTENTENINCYKNGISITLAKKDLYNWIGAFEIRYYKHLPTSADHKDLITIFWEKEKEETPVERDDGKIDFKKNSQLVQTIFYKVGNNEYRKTLTTTFYLTSKKNSIVFGPVAANSWKEHKLHVIKEIIESIKKNASYKNLMTKSSKYAFPKETVENPGGKAKKVKICFTGLEQNEVDCPASITLDKGDDFSSGDEENCSGTENNEASNSDKEEIRILKQKLKEKEIQKLKKREAELEDKREELEIKVSSILLDNEMFKKAYKSEKKNE